MAFLHVIVNFHFPRPSQKNEVCQCPEKTYKGFWFSPSNIRFFSIVKRLFHLLYFVVNLKPYLEELFHLSYFISSFQFKTNCFSIQNFGCIKNNIMTNDYIMAYRVVQFVLFNLFIIINEYAFNSFKIQCCFNFLWHMNKCNITKETQMIYWRFVITPNLFWCHAWNNSGKIQIWTYVAIAIVSSQKLWSDFMCCSMHHTFSTRVFQLFYYVIMCMEWLFVLQCHFSSRLHWKFLNYIFHLHHS